MARPRKPEGEVLERFFVGLPSGTLKMLNHFAALHGRTVTDEVRAALDLYIAEVMLDQLDQPEFVEEIAADKPGFDAEAERAKAEQMVELLRARAFGRPTMLDEHASVFERLAAKEVGAK